MVAKSRKIASWRAFLRELGSIVLGVLIALAFGAVASEIGWRHEASKAKKALGSELGEILGQGVERERIDPCLERKFDAIGAILTEADKTGRLPPIGSIGNPVWRTWSHNVWDSTLSTGIASHFDRDTLDNFSGVYEFVTMINHYSEEELDAWRRLYAIVGPGREISHEEIVDLRDALSSARLSHRIITSGTMRMRQIATAYELPVDQGTVAEYANTSIDRHCQPIAKYDGTQYGEATGREMVQRVRENPITKESIGVSKK